MNKQAKNKQTNKQSTGWPNKQTNGLMVGQMNGQTHGWTSRQVNLQRKEWPNWTNRRINSSPSCSYSLIHCAEDGALLEEQPVAGEGARLVGEEVPHLSQLLIQVGHASLCSHIGLRVIHLKVLVVGRAHTLETKKMCTKCTVTNLTMLFSIHIWYCTVGQ